MVFTLYTCYKYISKESTYSKEATPIGFIEMICLMINNTNLHGSAVHAENHTSICYELRGF